MSLDHLLFLANKLPLIHGLTDLDHIVYDVVLKKKGIGLFGLRLEELKAEEIGLIRKEIDTRLEQYKEFKEYLDDKGSGDDLEYLLTYDRFLCEHQIAGRVFSQSPHIHEKVLKRMFSPFRFESIPLGLELQIKDGLVTTGLDDVVLTLIGLDLDRIRPCRWCGELFYAKPKNKLSCTRRCTDSYNRTKKNMKKKERRKELKERRENEREEASKTDWRRNIDELNRENWPEIFK